MENVLAVSDTITAKETMTSVEIAEITGKEHKNVLVDIDNLLEKGGSRLNFQPSNYNTDRGKTYRCFELTKKGCLILASGYDAVLREKIINRWEQLETEKRNGGFVIPKTLSQALMLAAKQAEQIEQQQKQIEVKETQIAELTPKATYYDMVLSSKDAEPISKFSKPDYGMSAIEMNKLLHNWGIQYKTGET